MLTKYIVCMLGCVNILTSCCTCPLLNSVVFYGDVAAVAKELNEHPERVNQFGANDWSHLHVASFMGHETVVRVLLSRGALVNNFYDTESPLHLAAMRGHLNVVRLLLSCPVREPIGCTYFVR